MGKQLIKSDAPDDEMISWPPAGPVKKRHFDLASTLVVLSLIATAVICVLAAWSDTFSRFQEFEKQIDPYKTEIYYFIPIGSAFVAGCSLAAKRWKRFILPISVFVFLVVGVAVGSSTYNRQNSHRWGTSASGPVNLEEIALASPQIRARETFLTYMRLGEFLDGSRVYVHRNTSFMDYLNGFSGAEVEIDWDFDTTEVPFGRMTGMEIFLEGQIYKDRRLLLFGEGDSYHFYSTPETDYLVAD